MNPRWLIAFLVVDFLILLVIVVVIMSNSSDVETATTDESLQSYSGIILADEISLLEFPVAPFATVVGDVSDIPESAILARFPDQTWTVFQCNLYLHNSIGSFTEYRVCGMNDSGMGQRVIARDDIYNAVTDEDKLYLIGDMQGNLTDCRNQIYVADLDGSNQRTLIPEDAYDTDNLRICAISAVEINHDGADTVVKFDAWTGREGEYITHQFVLNDD